MKDEFAKMLYASSSNLNAGKDGNQIIKESIRKKKLMKGNIEDAILDMLTGLSISAR